MLKNTRSYSMYSIFTSIIIILFGAGLVDAASICFAQNGWTQKADIPTPRWFLSSCEVSGKIYAIGGWKNSTGIVVMEEYNTITNTWTTQASMPSARAFLTTSAVNGKIYAIGGSYLFGFGTTANEEYDPATNIWVTKAPMQFPLHGICSGVVDEKIYVIGGDPPVNKNEMYDPTIDTWISKQNMPTARWAPTCGVVNGKIYVFGGLLSQGGSSTDIVEMYDPATNTWTSKAHMPGARVGHATTVVDDSLVYIFGGTTHGGGPAFNNLWIYDPATDTWSTSLPNMPFNWHVMGYSVVNERVYLMAGSEVPFPHGDELKRVYEYDPSVTDVKVTSIFPDEFALHQNYPNPFNPSTTINYQVPEISFVTIKVYDVLGNEITTLVINEKTIGSYEVEFDASNLPSGIFFYRIQAVPTGRQAGSIVQTKKMVLMK